MTDVALIARLRKADEYETLGHDGWEAADRIELLATTNEQLVATNEALVKERDELLNQWDSAQYTITVWENRAATLKARAEAAEADYKRESDQHDATVQKLLVAEAALKVAVYVIEQLHGAVCGETGFASAVRTVSGIAYPWPSLDAADEDARAFLAKHQVSAEQNGSQK